MVQKYHVYVRGSHVKAEVWARLYCCLIECDLFDVCERNPNKYIKYPHCESIYYRVILMNDRYRNPFMIFGTVKLAISVAEIDNWTFVLTV